MLTTNDLYTYYGTNLNYGTEISYTIKISNEEEEEQTVSEPTPGSTDNDTDIVVNTVYSIPGRYV